MPSMLGGRLFGPPRSPRSPRSYLSCLSRLRLLRLSLLLLLLLLLILEASTAQKVGTATKLILEGENVLSARESAHAQSDTLKKMDVQQVLLAMYMYCAFILALTAHQATAKSKKQKKVEIITEVRAKSPVLAFLADQL